jgi:hypothetical protein
MRVPKTCKWSEDSATERLTRPILPSRAAYVVLDVLAMENSRVLKHPISDSSLGDENKQ